MTIVGELDRAIAGLRTGGKVVAQGSRLTFEVPDADVLPKRPRARKAVARKGPRGGVTEVQSLLFVRAVGHTPDGAKRWAQAHGYRHGDIDVTADHVRLRQRDPDKFKRLRTIVLGYGIKAIVGVR